MNGLSPAETYALLQSFHCLRDTTEAYRPCTEEAPSGLQLPVMVF